MRLDSRFAAAAVTLSAIFALQSTVAHAAPSPTPVPLSGAHWLPVTGLPKPPRALAAVSFGQIFAGGDGYLSMSGDGGATFNPILTDGCVASIVFDLDAGRLYAGPCGDDQPLRTSPDGKSWTQGALGVSVVSAGGGTVFGIQGGVPVSSRDNGRSFKPVIDGGVPSGARLLWFQGGLGPSQKVLLMAWQAKGGTPEYILRRSEDNGATWMAPYLDFDRPAALAVEPLLASDLFVAFRGGCALEESTDAGVTFAQVNDAISNPCHGLTSLLIDARYRRTFYAWADGAGMERSPDGGFTFVKDPGYTGGPVQGLYTVAGVVFAVAKDGLYRLLLPQYQLSDDGSSIEVSLDGGESFNSSLAQSGQLAPALSDPSVAYVAACAGGKGYVTRDGGQSWTPLGKFPVFAVCPINANVVYSIRGDTVIASTDGGGSWSPLQGSKQKGHMPTALATDPSDANALLAAYDDGSGHCDLMAHSDDGGKTWSPLPLPPGKGACGPLSVSYDQSEIDFSVGGADFASFDGGKTWNGQ
jgi:photosystem II stability/assembly factor-like uncharacterized protein